MQAFSNDIATEGGHSIQSKLWLKGNTIRSKEVCLSILCTLPGWIFAWSTGESIFADIAAIAGAIITLKWIWGIVGNPIEMFRFLRVGAVFLCAIQNVSWLASSFTHRFVLGLDIERSLRENTGGKLGVQEYTAAIIFVTLFSLVLAWLGSTRLIFQKELKAVKYIRLLKSLRMKKIRWIVIFFILLEVFLIATGVIGQRSIIVEGAKEGEQSLLATIYSGFAPFQIVANALLISLLWRKGFWRFKTLWLIFTVSMGFLLFIYFNKGRSGFVFAIIAFGYWLAFFRETKPRFLKLAVISLIVYPILSQILLFSNFIRSANAGIENWKGSAIDVIPQAWEKFRSSSSNIEEEKARTASNMAIRPLVATPLAICIGFASDQKSFMLGENFFNSTVWAIPGPFFPDKKNYPIQEDLLYKHFPIGDDDTADSFYLSAYTEFGWGGIVVYPLILAVFWITICSIIVALKYSVTISAIILALIFQLFILNIGEGSVGDWLVTMRTSLFFFVTWKLLTVFILKPRKSKKQLKLSF